MPSEPSAARPHPPVVPDPEQGCDACGEPMTNYDADGQWCDKHGKPSAALGRDRGHYRTLPGAKRMMLTPSGEIRALTGLLDQPEAPGLWRQIGRTVTMVELESIEIIEPFIKIGDSAAINLDEDVSRRLYALAWEKFERALVNTNALYNETPEGQEYQHNRVTRLLWESTDLKQAIEVIYEMTVLPEDPQDA